MSGTGNVIRSTLGQVARAVGGDLHGSDCGFEGVTTDTRQLRPGQLYVALRGPNFDGNSFVGQAIATGAAGAVVDRRCDETCAHVQVENTRRALGRLAADWRGRFTYPLLAVTGSNGKTTVKEMLASILRRRGPVLATRGNLNNDIGVPLTLLRLSDEVKAGVIEMGANHPGEIAYLTGLVRPAVGVVTNTAPAHLEGFGSREGVANAKGELFAGLDESATAVINADDPFAELWHGLCNARQVLTFALGGGADFRAIDIDAGARGGLTFELHAPDGVAAIEMALTGRHNVSNALAAAAACWSQGCDLETIRGGLADVRGVAGRLQRRPGLHGSTLVDDSYNANPGSLEAALDCLGELDGDRWLVLGDMGELGPDSREIHRLAGARARDKGVNRLLAFGELAGIAAESFGPGGEHFDDLEELVDVLKTDLGPDVSLLVKGSRVMRLERLVDALTGQEEKAETT